MRKIRLLLCLLLLPQLVVAQDAAQDAQPGNGYPRVRVVTNAGDFVIELDPNRAHLLPRVRIVPLVMGHQTAATAFALGEALAQAIAAGGKDVLLVASSDLSHYEDAHVAARLDAVMLDRVAALDSKGLMRDLEQEPRHACGGGPMVSVLDAATRLGASSARILRYADSGDVSADKSSVVGYMAAAIW